jgi:putative peptidoglycan lipid II flippase
MALLLLVSKLLGFARDWLIVTVYGASLATDAYFAAVQLPQASIVLLGGLGGPFHTATVAALSKVIARFSPEQADAGQAQATALAATLTTVTSGVFMVLAGIVFWLALPLSQLLLGGEQANPALVAATAAQLRIMAPLVWLGSLVGIFYGALNVRQAFTSSALSPTMLSIAMIVGLLAFPADDAGLLLAMGTLVGGVLQVALQLPDYFKHGFTLRPTLSQVRSPEFNAMMGLLFPAMVGTTIGQALTFVDMGFTHHLPEGGWSAVTLANRLMQLPIGVLQTALLVPLFPRLAEAVERQQPEELGRLVQQGVGALWWVTMPIMIFAFFWVEPVIRLVFEHGSFKPEHTAMVAWAVWFQLASMLPYFLRDTLTRVFYAYNDSKTPLLVGVSAIGVKWLLNTLLVGGVWLNLGVGGITASITLVTLINLGWLMLLVRRHTTVIPFGALGVEAGRMALACLPAGLLWAWWCSPAGLGQGWVGMLTAFTLGVASYAGMSVVLRLSHATQVLGMVRRKFGM